MGKQEGLIKEPMNAVEAINNSPLKWNVNFTTLAEAVANEAMLLKNKLQAQEVNSGSHTPDHAGNRGNNDRNKGR